MAEWSWATSVMISAGSLCVAAATFWTNRQARRADRLKAASIESDRAKTAALVEAKAEGEAAALARVEEERQAHLLEGVAKASAILGDPEEMARRMETIESRLHDLDGRGAAS